MERPTKGATRRALPDCVIAGGYLVWYEVTGFFNKNIKGCEMRYQDIVYGSIEIPDDVVDLFQTDLLLRLRGISQDSMPAEYLPSCTVPNRFQHGIGVWWLATRLTKKPEFAHLARILPIAGLLHDAGNTPFSHVGEVFLREATGLDGESHLRVLLEGSDLSLELKRRGISQNELLAFVTGKAKPWSDLLCGSMDIDNLDNIIRWAKTQGIAGAEYSPYRIVDGMTLSLDGTEIELCEEIRNEVALWKRARGAIYREVYNEPHFGLLTMLQRALEFAYLRGEIRPEFWRLADKEGFEYLFSCNAGSRKLAEQIRAMKPYQPVASWDGTLPSGFDHIRNWKLRHEVANCIARDFQLPRWKVAAAVSKARDVRAVGMKFRGSSVVPLDQSDQPFWRIRIYAHPELAELSEHMRGWSLSDLCRSAAEAPGVSL